MGKLRSLIARAPKRFSALVAIIAAAIIVPAAIAAAWGPDRPLFTAANPANFITFNSIKDSDPHGFEPNFVQVKESTASNSTYADEIAVNAGKEYTVYVFYHNNAASNLNLVAKDVTARVEIPATVPAGSTGTKAVGYISASNATPKTVWDDISFKNPSSSDVALRYVAGSATIHNFGKINGKTLPDTIVTTGAQLGYDELDGNVPGCSEYAGYITFKVKAVDFTTQKQVRLAGTTEWKENVNAKAGDTVEYQIEYKNTSSSAQKDIVIKDTLPKGVSYIAGSTWLKNSTNPNAIQIADGITTSGIKLTGTYAPGANAFIKFSAKVTGDEVECGKNTLKNIVKVSTEGVSRQDDADVTVTKVCEPGKITVCDLQTKKIITIDESAFDETRHSKDLKKCDSDVPPELPPTGIGSTILGLSGLGAVVASAGYYIASRRHIGDLS